MLFDTFQTRGIILYVLYSSATSTTLPQAREFFASPPWFSVAARIIFRGYLFDVLFILFFLFFLLFFISFLFQRIWVTGRVRTLCLSYPIRRYDIALSTPCTAQQCSIYVSYFVTTEFVSLEDEQSAPTRDVLELGDMSCPIRLSHSSTAAWDFANNKCYHLRFYTRFLMFFPSLLPPQTLVLCLS